jgi:hypothetical protein
MISTTSFYVRYHSLHFLNLIFEVTKNYQNLTMKTLFLLLVAALSGFPLLLSAQPTLHFFSDSIKTGNHNRALVTAHENEFIYVGGQSFDGDGFLYTPSVTKLDTAGNTLWTYSLNKEVDEQVHDGGTSYGSGTIVRLEIDANAVYAHLNSTKLGTNELWKLDKLTGNLLWKRKILEPLFVLSANSNELTVAYNANGNYNYDRISKATGQQVGSTIVLGPEINWQEHVSMTFDKEGAAYIGRNDSIKKYSSSDLSSLSWEKQIIASGYLTAIIPNDDGSIYIFGNRTGGTTTPIVIGRINKTDGNAVWQFRAGVNYFYTDEVINDVKITGDHVYVSTIHTTYGSVWTGFHLWKLNRNTGAFVWEKTYHPQTGTATPPVGSPYASALSLDIDAKGSVYATGYEAAGDSRIGQWGVVKFSADGNFIYHKSIFTGAPYSSQYSRGVMSYFYNNRLFYLGELQKSSTTTGTYVYLMATDTGSVFASYRMKKTASQYQEQSTVKRILPFSGSKYAVYSQLGHGIRITLKSTLTGNTIWEKDLHRGAHLAADQMAITADRKILISSMRYSNYDMRFDYKHKADSVFFIKFDSLGTITFESKYDASAITNLAPIQLYASGDSNNVYVYSMVDYYNQDNSIHFFNIDKSSNQLSGFGNYIVSQYFPLQARQTLLVPKSRDTAVHLQFYGPSNTTALYIPYKFNAPGFQKLEFKSLNQNLVIQNLANVNATSVAFSGKSQATGNYQIGRYQYSQLGMLWIVSRPTGQTVEGISTSYNSIYWTGKNGVSLMIGKLNPADGATQWEKTITPSSPNQYYIPLDQQYNPVRHQYTVCGFIEDRSYINPQQQAFYITVDTLGNVISQWSQAGDYTKKNQLNTIAISQQGQTLLGGALYKIPYGRSAVLIEADTIVKSIVKPETPVITVSPSASVCQGDTVTLTAASANCESCIYQWNDPLNTVGPKLKVTAAATYQVTATNSAGSSAASEQVTIKSLPAKPVITQVKDSLRSSAVTGNQWYLEGNMIPNANGQLWRPTIAGTYKVQTTVNGCSSPMSDGFAFTITAIIDPTAFDGQVKVFPNPVMDRIITINNMDHSLDLQVYDMTGKLLITATVPVNSTRELFVNQLKTGIYMLLITDTKTKKSIQKTLLKQ